jgi:hypothetical protein
MALSYRLNAISQGPEKSQFPRPNPFQHALVMDAARIKISARGRINHRCIISYITSPYVDARVDSNTFTMDNPMPESTLTLCPIDFIPQ